MSDQAELDRSEAKRARAAKHAKLTRSIAAQWRREGYHPYVHMGSVTHSGDRDVFMGWMQLEGRYGGVGNFGNWLAARDMSELFHDGLRRQRLAGMTAIKERSDG